MNDMVKLSICIPIYNQLELVKECIKRIILYKGDEIEIVINDDCSTEPIYYHISQFNDKRIKYFRNDVNLGHDRNILSTFRNASSKYVFLLRTRDYLIPEKITDILNYISNNPTFAYLTTSAYDSNLLPKLVYEDAIYMKGEEALKSHNHLYVHPSGSIYNKELLDFTKIDSFLDSLNISKYNFTIHSLLRMQLAINGNFVTLKSFCWIYSDTLDSTDTAVNSSPNNVSVYDTVYFMERYQTEMYWCNTIIPFELKGYQFLELYSRYLYNVTWANKHMYKDKRCQKHYNYLGKKINYFIEEKKFLTASKHLEKELGIESLLNEKKRKIVKKNRTKGFLMYISLRIKSRLPFKKTIKKILFEYLHLKKQ